LWGEGLCAWMMKNFGSVVEFFKLLTNRVIELGSQIRI
jgi:KUP system potassium uptake protein